MKFQDTSLPAGGRRWGKLAGGGPSVSVGEPIAKVEELAKTGEGVGGRKRLRSMYGFIAEIFDDANFDVEILADEIAESGLVDQGREVVVIGWLERGLGAVEPLDGKFESAPA